MYSPSSLNLALPLFFPVVAIVSFNSSFVMLVWCSHLSPHLTCEVPSPHVTLHKLPLWIKHLVRASLASRLTWKPSS